MDESTLSTIERRAPDPGPIDDRQQLTNVELVADMSDVGALRGVTDAAADLAPCTCPGPCERDHANE